MEVDPVTAVTDVPSISVVVPARNASGTLGDQLAALASQVVPGGFEVIVVDDGSEDATSAVAKEWEGVISGLVCVRHAHQRGANAARNTGTVRSVAAVVAFCDADDETAPGWLAALLEMARHADIVGGHLDEVALNRASVRSWRQPLTPGALPRAFGMFPYAVGANMAVRRSVWEALGGFDENQIIGATEVGFCLRAQLAGATVGFAPDAVVRYRHRAGLVSSAHQAWRWGVANQDLRRDLPELTLPAASPGVACAIASALRHAARGPAPLAGVAGAVVRIASFALGSGSGLLHQRPAHARRSQNAPVSMATATPPKGAS